MWHRRREHLPGRTLRARAATSRGRIEAGSGQDPLRIHFPPGQGFRYSGEGYYYLQSVITHLTGNTNPRDCARFEADLEVCSTDIDDFLKRRLLRPFRMHSSGYVWKGPLERHAAQPHDSSGELLHKPRPNATAAARYAACGGLLSTANDYARFLLQIL